MADETYPNFVAARPAATEIQGGDLLLIVRDGVTYQTSASALFGLVAQARTSTDEDYTAGDHRLDFDDVLKDLGSVITTGASWKLTIPATGSYMFILEGASVADLGADWAAGDVITAYLYKGVSTFLGVIGYRQFDVLTPDGQADANLMSTCVPEELTVGDQVWVQLRNLTASTRRLYSGARLTVMRVA